MIRPANDPTSPALTGLTRRARWTASSSLRSLLLIGSIAATFVFGMACEDGNVDQEPEPNPLADVLEPDGEPDGIVSSDCSPNAERFGAIIGAPLLQQTCINCHVEGGEAAGTRMVLVGGTTEAVAQANMDTLFALAGERVGDISLLVAKPTLRHPDGHGGGQVVTPGSIDEQRLEYIAAWGAGDIDDCTPPTALRPVDCDESPGRGSRQLRRLTRDEYLQTVFDLTGVTVDFVDIPLDQSEATFDSFARSLLVNDQLAAKLARVAEGVGERLETNLARVSPCGGNGGCRDDFLMEFGARTFRRPLTADEFVRYGEFFDTVQTQDGFAGAVKETVIALLVSPHFLYRAELGTRTAEGDFELTGYEIASELSYLLIGSMPDDNLLIAAAQGELATAAGREEQIARLVADPRSEATILRFIDQWLGTRGFEALAPATPDDGPALQSMRTTLEAEILLAIREGTSIGTLLTSEEVFVDQTLATHYGVAAPDGNAGYVDGDGRYGGLLRNGAVITGHSRSETVAPILRGLLIRERFLCQELPAPPANAASMQEELDAENGDTARAGSEARLETATCKGCHQLMDPIGFSFSDLDLLGRYRTVNDEGETPVVDGEIFKAGDAAGAFVGAHGLAEQLANSREVGACVQQMWFQFGVGTDDPELACNINDEQTPFDLSLLSGLTSSTQTDHFVMRRGGSDEGDGLATDALPLQLDGTVINPGEPEPTPEPEPGQEPDPTPEPTPEPQPDPGPGPDPEGPVPVIPDVFPDGVTVEAYQNLPGDDWGTGYCMRFRVNVSSYLGAWDMPIEVAGVINTSWNISRDSDSGTVVFSGEGFTADLGPGNYDDIFGYCADY